MDRRLNTAEPAVLVVDLNCAFASIEQQHDPALRGRPIAVAAYATPAATIVSSSREARDLGIMTGMRVFEAQRIARDVVVIEPNPPRYRAVSDRLIDILERHTPDVTRMSIDEAALDLHGTPSLDRLGPEGVGRAIKQALRAEVGECVTCSVGVSTSVWMAKQASNLDKRDGLSRIDHTNLLSVFSRLELTDLSGIAEGTARRLARAGVRTPLQFLDASVDQLRLAGFREGAAEGWLRRLRGFEVGGPAGRPRRSYSHSHVMARATRSDADLEELLMRLSEMVGRRLRADGREGRVVRLGIAYRPETVRFSRQVSTPSPVSTGDQIYRAALPLLALRDRGQDVGTLGVGISGLTDGDSGQLGLFDQATAPPRNQRLEKAMDAIRDRFGEDAVQRARLLGRAQIVRDRIAFGNTGHPDEKRPDRGRSPGRHVGENRAVAYDEALAARLRDLLRSESNVSEMKMFGGLAYLINGNMAVAASGGGGLLLRCDPAATQSFVADAGASRFEMRGRQMDGWLRVETSAVESDAALERWVGVGVAHARSLPPK